MPDCSPDDFAVVDESLREEIVQNLLYLRFLGLIVAARKKGIDIDSLSAREVVNELAYLLAR